VPLLASADMASDAQDAARRAFLIQSGLQATIDKTGLYMEHRVRAYVDKLGITYYTAGGLYLYRVYRDHSVSFPYHKLRWTLGVGDYSNLTPSIQCIIPF
jgi:hypothetical protein